MFLEILTFLLLLLSSDLFNMLGGSLGCAEFHTCFLLTCRKILQFHSKPSCTPLPPHTSACKAPGLLFGDKKRMQKQITLKGSRVS